MDVSRFIESRGSLAATWELHSIGMTRRSIAAAVAADAIVRVRQGWYCNPWLDVPAQRAARVGGQLACVSAARLLGLWIPDGESRLHVAVDRNACQLREPSSYRRRLSDPDAVIHWSGRDDSVSRIAVSAPTAIAQVVLCADPDFAFVVAESALNQRLITPTDWRTILDRVPASVSGDLAQVGTLSGSGIESIFVLRMRALGLPIRQQAFIPGVGYVDVLIGERLVVELDGQQFHQDSARDRHRDAVASSAGYRVLRFLANQVTREWPLVQRAVLAAIGRGDHLDPK